jgi:hypothetical protein
MTPTYSGEQATEIVRHARTGLPKLIADDIVGKTLRLFFGQRHQPVLAYGEAADALNLLPLSAA